MSYYEFLIALFVILLIAYLFERAGRTGRRR
jgi:hypothetical protein